MASGQRAERRLLREAGRPTARETWPDEAAAAAGDREIAAAAGSRKATAVAASDGPVAGKTAGRAPAAGLITHRRRVNNRHTGGQNRRGTHR